MRGARLNESPLGAAALAGTSFPIDRGMTAKALGFARPMANSLDAVADRDFVLETLSACAITTVHLSRFAEEIVIWSSPLVGFLRLSDRFTTGSSIMPQKRNPDAAELVRAKTGRIVGALTALLVVMKGLPLAYQKDMQEDKEGAIDAFGALSLVDRADDRHGAMTWSPMSRRMRQAAGDGYSTATDLADWLVRTLKLPFREAHHVTGRIVAEAAEAGVPLDKLPLESHAGDRAAHHQGGFRRAFGRQFGEEPQGLRRHGAAKRAGAGQTLAQTAEKAAVNGPVKALARGCRHNVAAAIWFAMLALSVRRGRGLWPGYRLSVWCWRLPRPLRPRCRLPPAGARASSKCRRVRRPSRRSPPRRRRRHRSCRAAGAPATQQQEDAAAVKNGFDARGNPVAAPRHEKIVHPRSDPAIILRATA